MVLSDATPRVTSWRFFAACLAVTATSLATFSALQALIVEGAVARGYTGDIAALQILDLRNGYSPAEVATLLSDWGPSGCLLYLLIEAVDVAFYHFGYRGAGLVMANRSLGALAARRPGLGRLALPVAAMPLTLAGLDFLEDSLQVVVLAAYSGGVHEAAPGVWQLLVGAASAANVTKWIFCRLACSVLGVQLVAVVGAAGWLAAAGTWQVRLSNFM